MNRALARLAALERRTLALGVRDRELRKAVAFVRQNLRSPDPQGGGACDRTWALTVYGCDPVATPVPLDGFPVEIWDAGGAVLAAGTTDGAGFVSLGTTTPTAADVEVHFPVTAVRLQRGPYTLSGPCGDNTAAVQALTDPTNTVGGCVAYFCLIPGKARPVKTTLQLVDPYFGVTVPLDWSGCLPGGTNTLFTGGATVSFAAAGACAARAALSLAYTLNFATGKIHVQHFGNAGGCPANTGAVLWDLTWDMLVSGPTDAANTLTITGINYADGGGSKLYAGTTPTPVVTEV